MKSFFIGNIEIKTPVIQGGMGVGISLSGLASAVANEGGVGFLLPLLNVMLQKHSKKYIFIPSPKMFLL